MTECDYKSFFFPTLTPEDNILVASFAKIINLNWH